jgi:hypothetical protein
MIVALISAFFLFVFAFAAKGVIAQAAIVFGAWVTKNLLLLGFFRTSTGKKTARAIRGGTYARLDGKWRRIAFRLFGYVSRAERATFAAASHVFGEPFPHSTPASPPNPVPAPLLPQQTQVTSLPLPKGDVPVEDLMTGIWRLGKVGAASLASTGRGLLAKVGR